MPFRLDREIPFVEAVFRIIEGNGSEAEAMLLLVETEYRHDVHIVQPPLGATLTQLPDALYQTAIKGSFFSFMADTNLLFSPTAHYDNLTLILPSDYTLNATWRAWVRIWRTGPT